jgi:hypothetical protein
MAETLKNEMVAKKRPERWKQNRAVAEAVEWQIRKKE